MLGSGPGELGDRITVADLELPSDLGTRQNQLAVHVAAIGGLVIGDREREGHGPTGPARVLSGTSVDQSNDPLTVDDATHVPLPEEV